MNKKIFALCCVLSTLGAHKVAAGPLAKISSVTLSLAAGIGHTHTSSVVNNTDTFPNVTYYPPVQDPTTKLYTNTYAKLNTSFTPAYYTTGTNPVTTTPLNGWYSNTSLSTTTTNQNLFPNYGNTNAIEVTPTTNLESYANYANIRTVAAAIDYSQVQQLIGATGVDVGGALGYKMYIDQGLYVHPSVKFAYFNAKSENAINSRYQEASFWTKNVLVSNGTASANNTAAGAQMILYGIDPETQTSEGVGGLVANAVTFQAQWYWNFITAIGYELTEGVSIEGQIGYQMTRFKMSVMEVNNEVNGIQSTLLPYNNDSTLNSSYMLNKDVALYDLNDMLTETEESSALQLSGLYMGFGFNFTVAKNLSLGMNMYHVFNAKRNFAIESVTVAPTVKPQAATTTQQNTTTQTGTQTTQPTTATSDPIDSYQDISIEAAQDISGLNMSLTYYIPVGASECNPAA